MSVIVTGVVAMSVIIMVKHGCGNHGCSRMSMIVMIRHDRMSIIVMVRHECDRLNMIIMARHELID